MKDTGLAILSILGILKASKYYKSFLEIDRLPDLSCDQCHAQVFYV